MRSGDTVARRFVVEREAGVGGMGRVFRAVDQDSGRTVALKVLRWSDGDGRERFEREARILSALSHPAIVGYVAHGQDDGQPFLAMEWLGGEPLSARLRKGALPIATAGELGLRVAEALACAHEAGVLHRDVKPANLILEDDEPDAPGLGVRVVDFGVARSAREAKAVTRTGMIVGSCSYMSPEQALAQRDVDARSDLFSLGCVLYECVTGVRAFGARDPTAALAKILLDEPAPMREIAPQAPRPLADLVSALLQKDRSKRPESARVVAERLRAILEEPESAEPERPPPPAFGTRERRVVWVVLASEVAGAPTGEETVVDDADAGRLRKIAESYGGSLAFLADATAMATFSGGVPTDEAPRAARCALALRDALPGSAIAIAMGRGEMGARTPIGEVIDDAADALRRTPPGAIRLHGVDPDWLSGFEIARDEHGVRLVDRAESALAPRTLLGRPTPCVGRERELAMLEGLFDDAAGEPQAKVALVTAPAGAGKSRLRHELLDRLARRDDPPVVLIGRCDALSAGSAFSAVGDAVRRAAGIAPSDDDETQRDKIRACAGDGGRFDRETHAALLGELAGVAFPETASEVLRSARRDSRLMGDHLRAAFEAWLASFGRPVVLVVEDLHWGDVPSVRMLDSALRNLGSHPLFVLALARPEIADLFPRLWADRGLVSIALSPLGRRAAAQLAREALGDADPARIDSLVERAQGNAFFLEELIRDAAHGESALPDSIFGVLQARLDALAPDARRVLRAASVYGDAFDADAVSALLGDDAVRGHAAEHLGALARAEILSQPVKGTFGFRHALVRDATYATLTDDDRTLGHRLAAELLERTGGAGPLALAEHFVRGGVPERAIAHLHAAAAKSLEGDDLTGTIALAERALALSPERAHLGALHLVCCEAYRWKGDYVKAAAHGLAAVGALDEGTVTWFRALGEYIAACAYRRDFESAAPKLALALAARAESRDARSARITCIARGCTQLLEGGLFDQSDSIAKTLGADADEELDDHARGWKSWLGAMRSLRDGDLATFVRRTEACIAAFERIGDARNTRSQRINLAYAYSELGAYERAEPLLRRAHEEAERAGLPMVCAYALQNLGNVLRGMGRLEEGLEAERRAAAIGESISDSRIEGAARAYGALMTLELGDAGRAEAACTRAIASLDKNPPLLGFAKAVLARALLARGAVAEAAQASREALASVDAGVEDGETFIRLVRIEMLQASGDAAAAREHALEAERRLRERAARIGDEALRASFLDRVPESRATLALAAALR
jgi:tetratricopeptide (TPR) repeat protein